MSIKSFFHGLGHDLKKVGDGIETAGKDVGKVAEDGIGGFLKGGVVGGIEGITGGIMSDLSGNMQNQMNQELQSLESAMAPMMEEGMIFSAFSTYSNTMSGLSS